MTREELERDRDGLMSNVQQMQGALQYVLQKIAALDKLEEGEKKECSEPSQELSEKPIASAKDSGTSVASSAKSKTS